MKKMILLLALSLSSMSGFAATILLSSGESLIISRSQVGDKVSCNGGSESQDTAQLEIKKIGYYYYMVNSRNGLTIGSAGHGEQNLPLLERAIKNVYRGMTCAASGAWYITDAWTGEVDRSIPFNNTITQSLDVCLAALYKL